MNSIEIIRHISSGDFQLQTIPPTESGWCVQFSPIYPLNRYDALMSRRSPTSGFQPEYGPEAKARILREFQRDPDPERDGTTSWSLTTLQRALRQAEDGLPEVSTCTLLNTLNEAGYRWQRDRSWSQTGRVMRKRKSGKVLVIDPDAEAKKR